MTRTSFLLCLSPKGLYLQFFPFDTRSFMVHDDYVMSVEIFRLIDFYLFLILQIKNVKLFDIFTRFLTV